VEVADDIEPHEDFCWLTLGQITDLLRRDNIVNMDARTVLSCIPTPIPLVPPREWFRSALCESADPDAGTLTATSDLLSWFTGQRSGADVETEPAPLHRLPGWHRTADEVARDDGRFFRVIAVSVRAGSREVTRWTQPLFEPTELGVAAFVVREFGGVLHILVHAKLECGFRDVVELAPTVQCVPANHDPQHRPFFLDYVLGANPAQVRFEAVHSEEGGRFLNAESRYMIVLADDTLPDELPPDYAWVTLGQLAELLRHGHYVNVQARTLVACLNSLR
jgi:oxidase EvaA